MHRAAFGVLRFTATATMAFNLWFAVVNRSLLSLATAVFVYAVWSWLWGSGWWRLSAYRHDATLRDRFTPTPRIRLALTHEQEDDFHVVSVPVFDVTAFGWSMGEALDKLTQSTVDRMIELAHAGELEPIILDAFLNPPPDPTEPGEMVMEFELPKVDA